MNDLKNKVVLITGASSGIGEAAALAFGRQGANVAVHYRSQQQAALAVVAKIQAAGSSAEAFHCDVMESAQLVQLVAAVHARFGRIDVLINNVGGMMRRIALSEASDEAIDEVFHFNARSMMVLCREVIPHMRTQGGGSIINITSQAANTGGTRGAGLYAASKSYITTYTKGLAREVVRDGIRVNAMAPGVIDTPIHVAHASASVKDKEDLQAKLKKSIPMGRLGRPDECAGVLLFLASEELSSYVTGQTIGVNGGSTMA